MVLEILQRAYVVCRLERKPDEKSQKADTDCDNGESSGNIIALEAAVPEAASEDDVTNFVNSIIVDPEENDYFYNSHIVDPEENNCAVTMENLFNNSRLRASSKRSYSRDGPVSSDTDNKGGNQRVKRYRSLAVG